LAYIRQLTAVKCYNKLEPDKSPSLGSDTIYYLVIAVAAGGDDLDMEFSIYIE
jgi:hypothetical protein